MKTPKDDQSLVESASWKNMGQFLHQFDPEIRIKMPQLDKIQKEIYK